MSSQQGEGPMEEVFPATDFREFIDSIQGVNAVGTCILASMKPQDDPNLVSFTADGESAKRGIAIAEALLERRRELDAHYGWVLASDAALVYQSMGGKSGGGAECARQWMQGIHDEYERIRRAMLDANLELEDLVACKQSDCKS
ncbi:hypothetical protein E8E11_012013 [Didymella keratinophila]|nr:hypothetical protein E8E11_012013 [Didymella keratinophila]